MSSCLSQTSLFKPNINLKITQYGIKIFASNISTFTTLKETLIEKNLEFFTHQLKEEQTAKFVLYGLPLIDVAAIKNELNSKGVFPTEVKALKIHKIRHDSHCNYLVYFKKSQKVKIKNLRDIKSLFQVIISWNFYTHKRGEVTQCSNCQGFGHGTQNCHMKPVCVKCAGSHKSKSCPLDAERDSNGKIPERKLFCVHCTHHHTANYHNCLKRQEYITRQKTWKTSKINTKPSNQVPQFNQINFPTIPSNTNSKTFAWANDNQNQFQNATRYNSPQADLFSPEQCFSIFKEFLSKMSSCQNRQQQLQVIGEITFKYLK